MVQVGFKRRYGLGVMDTVRIYGLGVMKIRIWFMLVVQVGRRRYGLGVMDMARRYGLGVLDMARRYGLGMMDRRVKTMIMNNKGFILGYIWLFYVFNDDFNFMINLKTILDL